MHAYRLCAALALLLIGSASASAERFPGAEWQQLSPAESGWSEVVLKEAHDFSDRIHSSAVVIVQHGAIVAEWGDTAKRTELASVRKSLLSALIGIAVGEHRIDLDATVGSLGIDDNAPSLTEVEKTATVRQLLEARSGVYHGALYETSDMAAERPARGSHPPGSFWYYNNWDFNALGTIYERATGNGVFDAFDREIAKPIGMQDYSPPDGYYVRGAASIHPAYTFRMSARDLARFALLYLRKGDWAGKQIVPADWVAESTRAYSRASFGMGYGYLWWTDFLGPAFAPSVKLPEGSFMALGAGGQYAVVIPALDLVVVHRVDRDFDYVEPASRNVGHLLWLILKAGGYDGGPDVSLSAAVGERPADDGLREKLRGRTMSFGAALPNGPYALRFEPDGSLTQLHGPANARAGIKAWQVTGDELCMTVPSFHCYHTVLQGERIELFNMLGVLAVDASFEAR